MIATVIATLTVVAAGPAAAAPAPSSQPTSAGGSTPAAGQGTTTLPRQNATFGIQPVTAGRIDSRTAFTYQTGPGGAYQDAFAVVNYGARPVRLQVYAADLTNSGDGGLTVGSRTDRKDGAAAWLRLPQNLTAVNVAAASGRTGPGLVRIPFAWAVPAGAAAGDHTAAIVVSLSVRSTGRDGQPVQLDQRVAARVFFRVSGTIRAQLSVEDFSVDYAQNWNPVGSGTAHVTYRLVNTGNVRLGAKQQLTGSAWIGSGGTAAAIPDQPLLLPGGSVRVSATVRDVVPGVRLTEKLHVTPVRAADDVKVVPTAVDAQTTAWAVPWALVLCILAVLIGLAVLIRFLRRRNARRPAPAHRRRGSPAPSSADTGAVRIPAGGAES